MLPSVGFQPPLDLWPDAGVYQLWLRVSGGLRATIGCLGRFVFPAGWYVYTGRAARGLPARVRRHVRLATERIPAAHKRWHIDYLLAERRVRLACIILASSRPADECMVNQATGGRVLVPGFGAGDCREHCRAQLLLVGARPGPRLTPARPGSIPAPSGRPGGHVMPFEITRADVWAGEIEDRPGALADALEALLRAGANLEFVIVRPSAGLPGTGVLFVSPLHGTQQTRAAEQVGLKKSESMHTLRIVGPDRPGQGAGIARTLAETGLNISGLSAAAIGDQCLFYIRFDTDADAKRAAQALTAKLG